MNSEDVAAYLNAHPEFFEQYADMIAQINIPHPHGGRTIPISERQILTLREKGKQLEGKLREVIQYGEENDVVSQKMHALSLDLLRACDVQAVVSAAVKHLRDDFAVPHVALRLWRGQGDAPEFQAVSDSLRNFANGLTEPSCSSEAAADTAAMFDGAAPATGSYAYVPLRDGATFGLLALASEEPKRYFPGMGTLYLARLGDLIGCALAAHLPPA
ncbi:MAG: DUF484 family protein [Betaproteobacteria bacterium]|nr:DUF484 family protein [Betaproteobacteria bacterium]